MVGESVFVWGWTVLVGRWLRTVASVDQLASEVLLMEEEEGRRLNRLVDIYIARVVMASPKPFDIAVKIERLAWIWRMTTKAVLATE
jgi:hypothetical protein